MLFLCFSLGEHLVGVYEDIDDNSTDKRSVFADEGGETTNVFYSEDVIERLGAEWLCLLLTNNSFGPCLCWP